MRIKTSANKMTNKKSNLRVFEDIGLFTNVWLLSKNEIIYAITVFECS